MGAVDKRPNGRWRARWREYPNGPQRSRTFDRKLDAERWLVKVQHDQLTGAYVTPELGRTTFRDVADVYLERGVWKPRSRKAAVEKLRYSLDRFGSRAVSSIRRGEVQSFVTGLTLAPATVKVVHQHLAAVLEVAVDDGLIVANPARKVKLPRPEAGQVVPMTRAEVDALTEAAASWFRAAIMLGAGLGLRQSEAAGLTVDRVDFLRRSVRVDRQWQQASGGQRGRFATPKTDSSARTIPAAPEVLDVLAAHIATYGPGGSDGFLVHRHGAPVDAARWGYYVRRARQAAGLDDRLSFHDLRHFFASALIASGCSVKAVQNALGHKSAKLTLDVYSHLWPGDEDRIRQAVTAVFSPAASSG